MFRETILRLTLFIIVIVTGFYSCDGRKSKNELFKASVAEFNDTIKAIEIVEYIPEEYSEIKTDTILSNGFSISIKSFTDLEDSVINTYQLDQITTQKEVIRNWISEVKVEKDGKVIFSKTINDKLYLECFANEVDIPSNSIKTGVWVEQEMSTIKDSVILVAGYLNPVTDEFVAFKIIINDNGKYNLEKIETEIAC